MAPLAWLVQPKFSLLEAVALAVLVASQNRGLLASFIAPLIYLSIALLNRGIRRSQLGGGS